MKVIILSAGQGRRLLPLTANLPKCALPVAGRSVLEWQLDELSGLPIEEVVVVSGFAADAVDAIVDRVRGLKVRTFYNPFYAHSDNLGSCWIARHEMDRPFILINGDTLFESAIPARLLAVPSLRPITLVTNVKSTYDEDDMKVIVENGALKRVGKRLDPQAVNGESIGMIAFRGEGPALFRDSIERAMRQDDGTRKWYLSAIDELAQCRYVDACPITGLAWCEIDDHHDLELAESVVSDWDAAPLPSVSAR
jgi:choline kinase